MSVILPILDPGSATKAGLVLPQEILDEEASSCVEPDGNSRRWIEQLLEAGHASDALRIMALVLPKKYALAWACECLRTALADSVSRTRELDRAGVAMAERWLGSPTEEHRRAALDFAERDEFTSAGAWVAAAAGWAEGSMAPKGMDEVRPPDLLTGEAVAAALLMVALTEPTGAEAQVSKFVASALKLFGGQIEVRAS